MSRYLRTQSTSTEKKLCDDFFNKSIVIHLLLIRLSSKLDYNNDEHDMVKNLLVDRHLRAELPQFKFPAASLSFSILKVSVCVSLSGGITVTADLLHCKALTTDSLTDAAR